VHHFEACIAYLHVAQHPGVLVVVCTAVSGRATFRGHVAVMRAAIGRQALGSRTLVGQAVAVDLQAAPQATICLGSLVVAQIFHGAEDDGVGTGAVGNDARAARNANVVFRVGEGHFHAGRQGQGRAFAVLGNTYALGCSVGIDIFTHEEAVFEDVQAVVGQGGNREVYRQRVVVADKRIRIGTMSAVETALDGLSTARIGGTRICRATGFATRGVVGDGDVVGGRQGDAAAVATSQDGRDRKSTRLNSSHVKLSYAVFCLNK